MRDNKERRLIIDLKGIKKRFFEGTENEIEVLKGIDLQVYDTCHSTLRTKGSSYP